MTRLEVGHSPAAIDHLEHDFACGYSHHLGDLPASLAVWFRPFPNCGHRSRDFVLFCARCWRIRCSVGRVQCNDCGLRAAAMDTVLRVEPLS